MKHRIFSEAERLELEQNPNISKVINSNVEFTEEFRKKVLYEHDVLGKTTRQIFKEACIPDWLNVPDYARCCIKRWRKQEKSGGQQQRGLKKQLSQKPIKEMSIEELRQRVAYLELENEFLKKLEPLEQ